MVSDSLAATDGDEGRILRVSGKVSPHLPAVEGLEIVVLSEDEFEWLKGAIATAENSVLLFPELEAGG